MKGITAASFLLVLLVVGWSSAAPSAKQLPRHAASVKKVGRLNSIDTILPVMNAKARALPKSSRVPDKRGMLPGIAKQLPKVSTSGLEKKTMPLNAPKPAVALPKTRIENVKEQKAQKILPFASKEAQAKVEEAKAVYDRKKAVPLVLMKQAPKAKKISRVDPHKRILPLTSTKQKIRAEKAKAVYDNRMIKPLALKKQISKAKKISRVDPHKKVLPLTSTKQKIRAEKAKAVYDSRRIQPLALKKQAAKAHKIRSSSVQSQLAKAVRPSAVSLPKSRVQHVTGKKAVQVPHKKQVQLKMKDAAVALPKSRVQHVTGKKAVQVPHKKQVQLKLKDHVAKKIRSHAPRNAVRLSVNKKN